MELKIHKNFKGIFWVNKNLATLNLVPGFRSCSEELIKIKKKEYRIWNPYKSKPAAAILKGIKFFPLKGDMKILYLGIASGTTASYFSDIIGENGVIYGVEISERSIRDLNIVAEKRKNIVPILADARKPEDYEWIEQVDLVYEDVAQPDQSEILIRNGKKFLKQNGFAMIAIKARSVDVTKKPKEIYKREIKKLSKFFKIIDKVELDPYEKDHCFIVMKKI